MESFERICLTWLSGIPTMTQAIVAEFMDEGMFATHVRAMRNLYRERHDVLIAEASDLAGEIDIQPSNSGFHAVGLINNTFDEGRIVSEAAAKGITVSPLSRYALSDIPQRGLVFGYGCSSAEDIKKGIRLLKDVLPACKIG